MIGALARIIIAKGEVDYDSHIGMIFSYSPQQTKQNEVLERMG